MYRNLIHSDGKSVAFQLCYQHIKINRKTKTPELLTTAVLPGDIKNREGGEKNGHTPTHTPDEITGNPLMSWLLWDYITYIHTYKSESSGARGGSK